MFAGPGSLLLELEAAGVPRGATPFHDGPLLVHSLLGPSWVEPEIAHILTEGRERPKKEATLHIGRWQVTYIPGLYRAASRFPPRPPES